jgi:serine kinase of HPr protein (carbohydrate metabolism regulator)
MSDPRVKPTNVHATAITVGGTGLLFLGPSGSGKSSLAFSCLAGAKALGMEARLIADDQLFLSRSGNDVLAECPSAIAGLMEIRYTGIVKLPYVARAAIHVAILPVDPATATRLPPENEEIEVLEGISLPAIRISVTSSNPLAIIMAKTPISFS